MRTLSILERKSVGGGLSSAGIKSQLGGYGAMPNGEGGAGGGGGLAANVAGSFTFLGNGGWRNIGGDTVTSIFCTPGTTFSFNLGLSTAGKIVNANTGLSVSLPGDCRIVTDNSKTGIQTNCPANGGTCQVINTKTGQQISSSNETDVDQSGLSSVAVGEATEIEMGGSDLAGGAVGYSSYGDYGGFGLGGDN